LAPAVAVLLPLPRPPSGPPSMGWSHGTPAPSCCGSWPIWPDAPLRKPAIFARNPAKLLGFGAWWRLLPWRRLTWCSASPTMGTIDGRHGVDPTEEGETMRYYKIENR